MNANGIITIVFTATAVIGIVGAFFMLIYDKNKGFNVFGTIALVSCLILIIMGFILKHWWIWVPAIIFFIISGLALLVNNLQDGPVYQDPVDDSY